jgi:hypothetical protein
MKFVEMERANQSGAGTITDTTDADKTRLLAVIATKKTSPPKKDGDVWVLLRTIVAASQT